jgi:hypothetical protein
VVIGNKRALVRCIDDPVVPNACGESEEALSYSCEDAGVSSASVLFESELAFEGRVASLE